MKIVINTCFGGFGLSLEAMQFLGYTPDSEYDCHRNIPRNDPKLIECIETIGKQANGKYAQLRIVEIPDDVSWHIEEYDGNEHIAEDHRTWS